jgi:dihydrolipoamide dehydrogenase
MGVDTRTVECDLAILGGGPAGYAAALYASRLGLKSAIVERDKVGGVCLHKGCIPTKHFLEVGELLRSLRSSKDFGILLPGEANLDWAAVMERKSAVVGQLHRGLEGLLKKAGARLVQGEGKLREDGSVGVSTPEEELVVQPRLGTLVATGSRPKDLPVLAWDGETVLFSDEALTIPEIPKRLVVVGAGSVGLEAASYFRDFGSEVVVLEVLSRALPGADEECVNLLVGAFRSRGIRLEFEAKVLGLRSEAGKSSDAAASETAQVAVVCETCDGKEEVFPCDVVLLAVGRVPNTEGIGLEQAQVLVEKSGHIKVDPTTMQTSNPRIWAAGDVVATPALAHVAFAEGMVAVRSMVGEDPRPLDYSKVPVCVYSYPEVAYAGLSEEEAASLYGAEKVRVAKVPYGANSRASIMGQRRGMLKVVASSDGPVLGIHIVGHMASELLSPGYLSVNWEALPGDVAAFIQPHPTLSEMYGEAAMALEGRPLHG